MKTVLFGTLAVLQLIGHANAQECEDLLKLALSQHKAAQNLIQQSDDLKDVAMARFQSGSNFQRPTQQAFTKMLEARGKLGEAVASLDKAVGNNCGSEYVDMRDDQRDNFETIKHGIETMRKMAPQLGVKLSGK